MRTLTNRVILILICHYESNTLPPSPWIKVGCFFFTSGIASCTSHIISWNDCSGSNMKSVENNSGSAESNCPHVGLMLNSQRKEFYYLY